MNMKRNVIIVNGTNPETKDILAKMKETGCTNLAFTGIGKAKAQKLVNSLPNMKIKFVVFRKLDTASEEYVKNNFNVVSTIGDFCKGKGKKVVQKKEAEMSNKEAQDLANKFIGILNNQSFNINLWGYSYFQEIAMANGATKTMRRGGYQYAYFGKLFVRYK